MKQTVHRGAFYAEAVLLTAIFVTAILLLVQCFAAAGNDQEKAEELTDAVTLARSAAEAAAGAESPDQLAVLLTGPETVWEKGEDTLVSRFDKELRPSQTGPYRMRIHWREGEGLVSYDITVENASSGRWLYSLGTAAYLGREGVS